MAEMPVQVTVIAPHEKIFPIAILLEVAMVTMLYVMISQKRTKISSKKLSAHFRKT